MEHTISTCLQLALKFSVGLTDLAEKSQNIFFKKCDKIQYRSLETMTSGKGWIVALYWACVLSIRMDTCTICKKQIC